MAVTLYCQHCKEGYTVQGEIPIVCPACDRETKWIVAPFTLTENDARFLRSIRVKAE